jgi:hypothetical protein
MVCTQFPNFVCSANEAPWYLGLTPAFGITLTNQVVGPDFGTTSYCLFTCPIIEQVPIGVRLVSTLGNLFIGGTIENCTDTGVYGLSGCNQDKFIGIDHELNTNNDYSIAGNGVEIIDCDTLTRVLFSGSGNRLRGGKHKSFDCQVGSSDNTFQDAIWNRTGGGGYLADSGTYNGFPRVRNAANSWFGRPLSIQSVTVTASPMTILNNTGDDRYYVISGGTLTGLFIGRFGGGQPIAYFPGSEIRVGPGEALALSYTIAPTITAYK